MAIKSTKVQRDALRKCHPGVGFLVYHKGNGETEEFEFYLDKKGQARFVESGQPITFDVQDDDAPADGSSPNQEIDYDIDPAKIPFDSRAVEILVANDRYLQKVKADLKVDNILEVIFNSYVLDESDCRPAYLEALHSLQK